MPTELHRNLGAGIISDELLPRADLAKVAGGVRDARNVFALPSGGMENRTGLRYVTATKEQLPTTKIRRFRFNEAQAYGIEVGNKYFRFYQTVDGTSSPLIVNTPGTGDVPESQTRYLGSKDDDLAALSGALISSYNIIAEKELRPAAKSSSSVVMAAPSGASQDRQSFHTTRSGDPGAAANWATGDASVEVRLTYFGPNLADLDLDVFLWRINASGEVQEKSSAANETNVDVFTAGIDTTYTFTFDDVAWTGPVLATDRFAVSLEWIADVSSSPGTWRYQVNTTEAEVVSTVSGQEDTSALPWDSGDSYVVGDVVSAFPYSEAAVTYRLSDETPAGGAPSGFSNITNDEAYAALEDDGTEATGQLDITVSTSPETQVLIANDSEAWDDWPDENITVSLDIGVVTAISDLSLACRAVRVNSANALQTGPTYADSAEEYDTGALGAGNHVLTFTCPPPSDGWGTTADTDKLAIEVRWTRTGGSSDSAHIELGVAGSFVTVPAFEDTSGTLVYYYCVADHSGKDPRTVAYQNDFWYVLPVDSDGDTLLKIPTPHLSADLGAVDWEQSADVITLTEQGYPPHELVRNAHETMAFGRWTALPISFKPLAPAPTGIYASDPGIAAGGANRKRIRYQVTFIDDGSGSESLPGSCTLTRGSQTDPDNTNLTDVATISDASAQSTTADLTCALVSHGLSTGDVIHIENVATTDADRAHQNAKELLEGGNFAVTLDADTPDDIFTLDGTAGQLTVGPIADVDGEGYPSIQITYGLAYVDFIDFKVPKGEYDRRIELTWDAPTGSPKGRFLIYREIEGEEAWGLIGSTTETVWADTGDSATNSATDVTVAAKADTENPPPVYINPFSSGNWPRCSSYHGGRQWFAGTEAFPLMAWGSAAGDFRNFSTRLPITPADAIEIPLTLVGANEIQRMSSLGRTLTFYTTGGVVTAEGGPSGLVPTETPTLTTLTYKAAAGVTPVNVDQSTIFIHNREAIVREMRFNLGTGGGLGGYEGRNLSLYAPDLFEGYTISELSRSDYPLPFVGATRSDGQLLTLMFVPEHDAWGWTRHPMRTGDKILSHTIIPEEGKDALYAIVQRSVNGSTVYHVERMDPREVGWPDTDDRATQFFLDSGLTYNGTNTDGETVMTLLGGATWEVGDTPLLQASSGSGGHVFPGDGSNVGNGYRLFDSDGGYAEVEVTGDPATNTQSVVVINKAVPASLQLIASTTGWVKMVDDVSGLDHLEGETVGILADGNVLATDTISSGAISTLSQPYGIIHVGLLMQDPGFDLLDIDRGDDQDTTTDLPKKIPQIALWLTRSRGVKAGPWSATPTPADWFDFEPEVREGDVAGSTALVSGKRRVFTQQGDWTMHGRATVAMPDPVAATVTAVAVTYETGKRP